jgi:hypothetical protein
MNPTIQTFNQTLQHWVTMYMRSTDMEIELDAFTQTRLTVRDMESKKILKPVIFYQVMMVLQALTVVANLRFDPNKVKKLLAIMYPDEEYVTNLTSQVLVAINQSEQVARENPNNAPILDQLRHFPTEMSRERNAPFATNQNNQRPADGAQQNNQQNNARQTRIGPPPGPVY